MAKLVGVTPSTVSRAFSRPELISEETRERIYAAAKELNYRPNALAGALTTKRTLLVGLMAEDIQNPYVASLARGVQDGIVTRRYLSIVCSTGSDPDLELDPIQELVFRGVDGLIVTPSQGLMEARVVELLATLPRRNVPLVFIGKPEGIGGVDYVTSNAERGAIAAVEHLHALGHVAIALIAGRFSKGVAVGRWRGFVDTIERLGLKISPEWMIEEDTSFSGGYGAMKRILAASERPTAVFTINDLMATGALDALREAGLNVPREMSIVGFDDVPTAATLTPPLTTLAQPAYDLGRAAADLLLERIDHPDRPPQSRHLSCQLVLRSSTAAPIGIVQPGM